MLKRRVVQPGWIESFRLVEESVKRWMNMVLELRDRNVGRDGFARYRDRVWLYLRRSFPRGEDENRW